MKHQHRGAVIDRLMERLAVTDDNLLAVQYYATDVVVTLRRPLEDGEKWDAHIGDKGTTFMRDLVTEDVTVRMLAYVLATSEVAA